MTADGQVLAVATSAYRPLGFDGGPLPYAPLAVMACVDEKVLVCPPALVGSTPATTPAPTPTTADAAADRPGARRRRRARDDASARFGYTSEPAVFPSGETYPASTTSAAGLGTTGTAPRGKEAGVTKTTASGLTLITDIGRVPVTRSQIASWRRRVAGSLGREHRPFGR